MAAQPPLAARLAAALALAALVLTARAGGAEPSADAGEKPERPAYSYWNGRILDLSEFQVTETLPGEPVTHEVEYAGDIWRVVDGRRLQGYRLRDARLIREYELRAPCRHLFVDDEHIHAVTAGAVETFPRGTKSGAATVEFPGGEVADAAHLRDAVAILLADTGVRLVSGASRVGERLMTPEIDRVGQRQATSLLVAPATDLVCRMETLPRDYRIRCVDREGKTRWEASVRHTTVTEEGASHDVFPRRVGRAHALFGTKPGAEQPRTIVIGVADGERVLDIPRVPGAILEDGEGKLLGLLSPVAGGGLVSYIEPDGKARWTVKGCEAGQGAHGILAGDRLVVTCYDPAGSGGELFKVDAATGEREWTAEVAKLGRVRGEYTNDMTVRRAGDLVFLDGNESALDHLQVFELDTGARRYVDVRRKW